MPHRRASAARSGSRPSEPRSSAARWKALRSKSSPWRSWTLGAGLEPDALADLVRRRLAGQAEVALDLELDELVVHPAVQPHELQAELGRPRLAGVEGGAADAEPVVRRDLQLEVHADVDDDAGRAQRLAVEHAEQVGRVVEEAELLHQPLGVERPALAVAAAPAHQPLPAVEGLAAVGGLRDLEVVAGDALVEDGRDLAPRVEVLDAVGHRPPHPARARRSPRTGRCSRCRRRWSARACTRCGGSARGCRSGRRPSRRWCGRRAPASSRGTPRGRARPAPGRRRGGRPPRRRRRRAGSARRSRASGRRAAAARPSPRRRSRRGRPRRRGSSGWRGRRPRGRRPPCPCPAARARR